MRVKPFFFILTVILTFSCNENQRTIAHEKPIKFEKVKANKMLTFEIEGMVCVMGCGGSIRSKLKETNAVEKCEFDFKEGREKNKVTVSFDEKMTSPEKIIKIITDMNDGQFTVGASESGDISINIKTTIQDVPEELDDKSKSHI